MPRAWHATIAILVAAALVLQVWIAARVSAVPPGHAVGALRGVGLPGRILRVFSFFTIQSNAISGVVSAQLARRPARDGSGWRVLRLAALLGMLLGWLLYGPRPRVSARVVLWALTWPALYLAYTLIAGAISGWYPYPFLDAASNGYPRVLINAVLVVAVFAAVGSFSGGGIDGYRHRNPLCVRRVQ
jgi:hypothetical protein